MLAIVYLCLLAGLLVAAAYMRWSAGWAVCFILASMAFMGALSTLTHDAGIAVSRWMGPGVFGFVVYSALLEEIVRASAIGSVILISKSVGHPWPNTWNSAVVAGLAFGAFERVLAANYGGLPGLPAPIMMDALFQRGPGFVLEFLLGDLAATLAQTILTLAWLSLVFNSKSIVIKMTGFFSIVAFHTFYNLPWALARFLALPPQEFSFAVKLIVIVTAVPLCWFLGSLASAGPLRSAPGNRGT